MPNWGKIASALTVVILLAGGMSWLTALHAKVTANESKLEVISKLACEFAVEKKVKNAADICRSILTGVEK